MLKKNANLCAEEMNSCWYISVHGGKFHIGWTKQSLLKFTSMHRNVPYCFPIIKVIQSKANDKRSWDENQTLNRKNNYRS